MSNYYGPLYNRYGGGRTIAKGDHVEVLEDNYRDVEVLYVGTVVAFDNRRASDGYTVLVRRDDDQTEVWTRPDELKFAPVQINA